MVKSIHSKNLVLCLAMVLFLALSSLLCSALGVSPSSKTINYAPGTEVSFDFWALNSEGIDINVSLSSMGPLSEYIFFENRTIVLSKGVLRVPFKVFLRMPQGLEPGLHIPRVVLTPSVGESSSMFQAYAAPLIPIIIRSPFPSKFASAELTAAEAQEGVPVPIQLEFDNLGSEDIKSAGGSITVFNSKGAAVHEMQASPIQIRANSFGKTEGTPRITLGRGSYTAKSSAFYDDVILDLSTSFFIGEPVVKVGELKTQTLYAGEINKVTFSALLEWDAPIIVSGAMVLDGQVTELPSFELKPEEETDLTWFLDLTNAAIGEKELVLMLVYASSVEESRHSIQIVKPGAAELAGSANAGIIIAILLAVAVLLFILFWMMRHKPEQKPSQAEKSNQEVKDLSHATHEPKSKDKSSGESDLENEGDTEENKH